MPLAELQTHEVLNQSLPFQDVNLFTSDNALCDAVSREGAGAATQELTAFGETAGSGHALRLGRLANDHPPILHSFNNKGFRVDTVEFHPAWHELMAISTRQGLHNSAWQAGDGGIAQTSGANVGRCAGFYMAAQMEHGHCCPVTMTNAVIPALAHQPDLSSQWLGKIMVNDYDPSFAPRDDKRAVLFGMGMTEKQGGTDVRANTTRATSVNAGGPGQEYLLTGHKWFLSAPMCDAFLVLAQAPGGLSCFLLPRFLPDGSQNPLQLQRLKDKLGNKSNASSEVEFAGAHAWMIGEEGRGVNVIIEMVTRTRLDCAVASAGMMRWALANAIHHTQYRTVFQRKLIDQPLMRQVLADLALDHEAAVALVFRLARAFDRRDEDPGEAFFARLMTPAIKYWVCKALPNLAYEAVECLGGNGYVEDGPLARVFREAPLNAIWEGSGNVMCLDILRVASKQPEELQAFLHQLEQDSGGEPRLVGLFTRLRDRFANPSGIEADMRYIVEQLVYAIAGYLLVKNAPPAVSDAFIVSRLKGGFRHTHGSLRGANVGEIIERAAPQVS